MIYSSLILLSFISSLLLTKAIISFLQKKEIMDTPNHRSFHEKATPIGGGWAIIATCLPLIIALKLLPALAIVGSLILIIVSWRDDIQHINPFLRLGIQIFAVLLGMFSLPADMSIFNGLFPIWLEKIGIFFAWIWFTNLYNFMDGIDGITGSETVCICAGISIISLLLFVPAELVILSSILMGASLGFLVFNWQPAKIFIGDVGAIFLGYILAYLILMLASQGYITIALLLPLYHLMDATIIIVKRAIKKEKIWEAHQQQFFHRSVNEMGRSHAMTTTIIIGCNLILIMLCILSVFIKYSFLCLLAGIPITFSIMYYIANRKVEKK